MNCGLDLDIVPERLLHDGEEIECSDCHSKNIISIDEDEGAFLSRYICRHGKREDEPCAPCEIEDAAEAAP